MRLLVIVWEVAACVCVPALCIFSHCGDNYLKEPNWRTNGCRSRGKNVCGGILGCRQNVGRMNCIIIKSSYAYWLHRSCDRIVEECPGSSTFPRPMWDWVRTGCGHNELLQMENTANLMQSYLFHFDGDMQMHEDAYIAVAYLANMQMHWDIGMQHALQTLMLICRHRE